jgi:hypothetical protein
MAFDFPGCELPGSSAKFFATFSRLEFALKRAGFASRRNGTVSVDWERLDAAMHPGFFDAVLQAPQAQILFSDPPQKQILSETSFLSWKKMPAPTTNVLLVQAVKRIRNNLFHGGKTPGVPGNEPARNEALLQAGLFVIAKILQEHPQLDEAFRSP